MRTAVLASGSGTNLQALIDAQPDAGGYEIVLVASDNAAANALERASNAAIDTAIIENPADGAAISAMLASQNVDLVVLAGYMKLVPEDVVEKFAGRMINLHPALLPAFGGKGMYGMNVHRAVLESGAAVSGATVHLIDAAYDRGPIVAQWPVPVQPGDTPESLQRRVSEVEHVLLPIVVREIARHGAVVSLKLRRSALAGSDRLDLASALQAESN